MWPDLKLTSLCAVLASSWYGTSLNSHTQQCCCAPGRGWPLTSAAPLIHCYFAVVTLKEIFLTPKHLAIVLELVPGGDLYSFVRSRRGCSEKQVRCP